MRGNKTTPDGIEIIAREPALAPHPHPRLKGKLVPFSGVSKLLLADDTECYECDRCGDTFDTARQVTSHASGKHAVTAKRATNVETVKIVLRVLAQQRAQAKAEGRRSFLQETADELNRRGIKSYRGQAWTDGSVNHLYLKYHNTYRTRTPRIIGSLTTPAPVKVAAEAAVIEAPPVTPKRSIKLNRAKAKTDVQRLFSFISRDITNLREALGDLETHVSALNEHVSSQSDLPLDDDARNALELLRRAWQRS
jgi:hypothetical protein